ncbi:hypothetical protein [Lacinutrix sp. Bg11-31]|uniref:hypothetical protein n=1 Tax=Lacinutrix sp. Bg11-31 TaxID=2057808 RepID=UPI000C30A1FA|nr:hypothetical protein [Lacinutrix sp. Bg11-31]AUC82789.1 hypothetical protein CW733_11915 [Lacinutrix sp. Bg11-31]
MNSKNYTLSKGKDTWSSDSNGEEVYKVSLSNKKLTMHLDKDIASSTLAKKFETLGSTIRIVIVGEQNETRRDAERLQREADRLRRDAERMQSEADRIQREAQRQAASTSNQYRDDAIRIAYEASGLNLEAAHKGAVSSIVKQLLADSKTAYNNTTKSGFNWTWPKAQNQLLDAFKKDNLIHTKNDVVFIKKKQECMLMANIYQELKQQNTMVF